MRLATVRAGDGTTACVRVDHSEDSTREAAGVVVNGVSHVGELLATPNWREIVATAGSSIEFSYEALAPVIPTPGKIICVGLNYAKHILEMGRELPDFPTLFIKYPEALTGPFDDIYVPEDASAQLDAESELAVVIGARCHRVSADEAGAYIAGYCVMNDYTLRDWQRRTVQFHQGKSYYKTSGFGPWLTTAEDWEPGPRITATWNGDVMQDSTTDDLIFDCETLVSFVSQIYPLNPGDVIATGTPDGVGFAHDPKRFIQSGESVRCAIEGLGFIDNTTFIGEAPAGY